MEKTNKQNLVRKALIDKFEGVANKDIMKKYPEQFRNMADMYSQFRSYLYALAKTKPEPILKLLKDTTNVEIKSVRRSIRLDIQKRLHIANDVLESERYDKVAEEHELSVARTRGIFMEVVAELSEKHSLGIPEHFGKKQIIFEHKERLISVISKTMKHSIKKGATKKAVKKSSPKRQGKK